MKNHKLYNIIFIVMGFMAIKAHAQWTQSGTNLTTTNKVTIGSNTSALQLDVLGSTRSRGFEIYDDSLGNNHDKTLLFRDDVVKDKVSLKLKLGDEGAGSFDIGYAKYQDGTWVFRLFVDNSGKVGIRTNTPDATLAVNGTVHAKEVRVNLNNWPDYVFDKSYPLQSLKEVKKYIAEHGHLPHVAVAKEVLSNGLDLGEHGKVLLEKIEELTLYTIKQQEEIEQLKKENLKLKTLEKRVQLLENKSLK